ncbi:hypothetical protein [Trinickia symbiotica]|uniref:hypothetical protein n=1 Tax=Trinickia symbiotica TaxID=863227 RepID=UPI0015E71F72|nr:hypothetical protein [Trinickia symbiotica]
MDRFFNFMQRTDPLKGLGIEGIRPRHEEFIELSSRMSPTSLGGHGAAMQDPSAKWPMTHKFTLCAVTEVTMPSDGVVRVMRRFLAPLAIAVHDGGMRLTTAPAALVTATATHVTLRLAECTIRIIRLQRLSSSNLHQSDLRHGFAGSTPLGSPRQPAQLPPSA